jgi:hypothetical protein
MDQAKYLSQQMGGDDEDYDEDDEEDEALDEDIDPTDALHTLDVAVRLQRG